MDLISLSVKYNIAPGNTVSLSERSLFVNDIAPLSNVVFNHMYVYWSTSEAVGPVKQTVVFSLTQKHILKLYWFSA